MKFNFYKYHGTGNDFILIDNRAKVLNLQQDQIAHLCDRKFGIGADGLMLLEDSDTVDFEMVYYNSDGKTSSMCGNGGRCITSFAKLLNIVSEEGKFMAIDGLHEFTLSNSDTVVLKMNDVSTIRMMNTACVLDTGSPHYVEFIEDIDKLSLVEEAHLIRYNDEFRNEGINVNFVELVDEQVFMRTYERGVEDETLSCGTGTVAVALSLAKRGLKNNSPIKINTPGGELSVHFTEINDGFSDIWLEGPTKLVFTGQVELN